MGEGERYGTGLQPSRALCHFSRLRVERQHALGWGPQRVLWSGRWGNLAQLHGPLAGQAFDLCDGAHGRRVVRDAEELPRKLELATRVVEEAETEAERLKEDARERAKEIIEKERRDALKQAAEECDRIRESAELEAQSLIEEANREGERIANKVRQEAQAQVEKECAEITREARLQSEQVIGLEQHLLLMQMIKLQNLRRITSNM